MKFFKYLFSFLFLLTLSINFSLAAGTLDVCPGQDATLQWTSTGAVSCGGGLQNGNPICNFVANLGGSQPITNPQSGCTVNYSCSNAAPTPASDFATLNVVNGPSCCNLYSQVGLPVWNGTTCVANPTGSITGGTCTIFPEQSSCNNTISWTSNNNPAPAVVDDFNGTVISNLASLPVGGVAYSTPYGTRNVILKNGATPIAPAAQISAVCSANHFFVAGVCKSGEVVVTLTAPNCTIAYNEASCNVDAIWKHTSGLIPGTVIFSHDGYSPAYTAANSGTKQVAITAPNTTYNTWVGGQQVSDNAWVNAIVVPTQGVCASNTTWLGGKCTCTNVQAWNGTSCIGIPVPTATLTIPASGGASSLSCTNSTSYSLSSSPTFPAAPGSPWPKTGTNATYGTMNLNFTATLGYSYSLTCTGPTGSDTAGPTVVAYPTPSITIVILPGSSSPTISWNCSLPATSLCREGKTKCAHAEPMVGTLSLCPPHTFFFTLT
jgi:hypothetical protein